MPALRVDLFAGRTIEQKRALATALSWWRRPERVHRLRVLILTAALLVVAVSVPIGTHVSDLRLMRFDVDPAHRHGPASSVESGIGGMARAALASILPALR